MHFSLVRIGHGTNRNNFVNDNNVDLLHPQYHDDDDDTTVGEDSMDEEHGIDNAVDLLHPQYHDDDDDSTDGEDSMDEDNESDNDHSHHGSNRHDHSPISKNQSDGGAKSVEDSADTSTQQGTTTTALPSNVSSPPRPPLPNSTSSFRQHPPNQPMSRPMTPVGTGGLTPRTLLRMSVIHSFV